MEHFFYTYPQPVFLSEVHLALSVFEKQGWEFVSFLPGGASPKSNIVQSDKRQNMEPVFFIVLKRERANGETEVQPPALQSKDQL